MLRLRLLLCLMLSCAVLLSAPLPANAYKDLPGKVLLRAAASGREDIAEQALGSDADPDYREKSTGQTPLIKACTAGSMPIVEMLIKAGADVNLKTHNKNTALIAAARNGQLECVQLLLAVGANASVINIEGKSAADVAEGKQKEQIRNILIQAGAPTLNSPRKSTNTLSTARQGSSNDMENLGTCLLDAASRGDREEVRHWLHQGASVDFREKSTNQTALIKACAAGSLSCVKELIAAGANANAKTFNGNTALIAASRNGHAGCVRELLRQGADRHIKNCEGQDALDIAAQKDNQSVIRVFEEEKSSKSSSSSNDESTLGQQLLAAAAQGDERGLKESLKQGASPDYREARTGQTALVKASAKGSLACVRSLIAAGADVNAKTYNGNTPLIAAARNGHPGCARELLKHGADKHIKNVEGKDARDIAKENKKPAILSLLEDPSAPGATSPSSSDPSSLIPDFSSGQSSKQDLQSLGKSLLSAAQRGDVSSVRNNLQQGALVDHRDPSGKTPLMAASASGSLACVKALIAAEANVNAKNNENETPLHFAVRNGHVQCVKELLNNEANPDIENREGKDARGIAQENQNEAILALLKDPSGSSAASQASSFPPSLASSDMQSLGESLLAAAQRGDVSGVRESLDKGALVDHRDESGKTALMLASSSGSLSCVKELVAAGADVNAQTKDHETSLTFATRNGHTECARELRQQGATAFEQASSKRSQRSESYKQSERKKRKQNKQAKTQESESVINNSVSQVIDNMQ